MEYLNNHIDTMIICVAILTIIMIVYKAYRFHKITELDRSWRKYHENGNLAEEIHRRPIWDYSYFPGVSKAWHQSKWQTLIAIFVLLFILILYLYTDNEKLINLLSMNLGIVLGMMINDRR